MSERSMWKAGQSASGWTPVREDKPASEFPRVMALADSEETAALIVKAVNERQDLAAVQRNIAANLAGDLSKLSREQMLDKLQIIAALVLKADPPS